ncbi:MAG: hypothetical protein AAFZ99_15425 [Pseudomonadota bacterium]
MKVSITPGTKQKGLLFKSTVHTVSFSVTFSEEEKAKVDALGIKKHAVVEGVPFKSGAIMDLTVDMIGDGYGFEASFENEGAATGFIGVLKGSLQNLKAHMDAHSGPAQAEEFEL